MSFRELPLSELIKRDRRLAELRQEYVHGTAEERRQTKFAWCCPHLLEAAAGRSRTRSIEAHQQDKEFLTGDFQARKASATVQTEPLTHRKPLNESGLLWRHQTKGVQRSLVALVAAEVRRRRIQTRFIF